MSLDHAMQTAGRFLTNAEALAAIDPIDAIHRLETAGFVDAREVERTWAAPLRLVVGRRP